VLICCLCPTLRSS